MGPPDWNKLTTGQKDLLRALVASIRNDEMPEEFTVMWGVEGTFVFWAGLNAFRKTEGITAVRLDALEEAQVLRCNPKVETTQNQLGSSQREMARDIALTALAYKAVDTNFEAPDLSYVQLLTPLAKLDTMDPELVSRCFPILGAGPGDPKMWDSAVRTAGVILEDRLRRVGGIEDGSMGQELVNKVLGKTGTLSKCFSQDAQRQSYRDLLAGMGGAFRNPSAHRLVDPVPHEAGAYIVFVNLLLGHLERLAD